MKTRPLAVAFTMTLMVTSLPAAAAVEDGESVGVVDLQTGVWYLRDVTTGETTSFHFGDPGDLPFVGDWDCDGVDTPGLYRQADGFVFLRNSNDEGVADIRYYFGNPGDLPLVGDFDGDGCDTVSIYRPSQARFFIINELGAADGGLGAADFDFLFGDVGDAPFVGDFDDDGRDSIGLHRPATGLVYFRDSLSTGIADSRFVYGDPGDQVMAGRWAGTDGPDTVGLFRAEVGRFYLRNSNTAGNADVDVAYGNPRMVAVAGTFGALPGGDSPPRRDGAVDAAFGSGGVAAHYSTGHDIVGAMAIQPDGKIVLAARIEWDIALLRFTKSGELDASFGADGVVTADFGDNDEATAIVIQPDGRIVVAGNTDDGVAVVVRYLQDGTPDPTFSGGSVSTEDLMGSHRLLGLALQPDGKIVAVGEHAVGDSYDSALLLRFLPDGTLDGSFGVGGRVVTTWTTGGGGGVAVAMQRDGRIVIAGYYHPPFVGCAPDDPCDMGFAVLRYRVDGAPDPTFGIDGRVTSVRPGETNFASALAIQPDGNILVAGSRDRRPVATSDFYAVRYRPDSTVDPAFGSDGEVATDFGGSDGANAAGLDAQGRIILAGFGGSSDPHLDPDHGWVVPKTFAIARYSPVGSLDATFGEYGKALLEIDGIDLASASAMALQADGNVLLAGTAEFLLGDVAMVRVIGDAPRPE